MSFPSLRTLSALSLFLLLSALSALSQTPPTVQIHDIQGVKSTTAATISPYVGQQVTTTGVVTAVLSNGFFIQSLNPDANPLTPEGIDVFTSSKPPTATVAIGNVVTVTGTVLFVPTVTLPKLALLGLAVVVADVPRPPPS